MYYADVETEFSFVLPFLLMPVDGNKTPETVFRAYIRDSSTVIDSASQCPFLASKSHSVGSDGLMTDFLINQIDWVDPSIFAPNVTTRHSMTYICHGHHESNQADHVRV